MSYGMFPRPFWVSRFSLLSWPVFKGSDEWFRHTLVVGIPGLVSLVIPYKRCDCDDLANNDCTFPGCPFKSCVQGGQCMTHDEELWADIHKEAAA